jgi:hypothetical protein
MKRCPKCANTYADEANFCPVDAGRLVTVATDVVAAARPGPGVVGGRFELGPAIGGTHTGPVHRSVDTTSGVAVAVKLVDPAVLAIPHVAQRIERELKQLERVQHRGVAQVVASGRHGDQLFVASELIDGGRPLSDVIAAAGPVDAQRASEVVLAVGDALIEAAKVGVVHRDLAPKNILVTGDTLWLVNFAVPTPGDRVAGVPEFVAPEAIEGKPVDQRSNIYSLAAIFYFLLTGRAPHTGEPAAVLHAHLTGAVEPPSRYAAVPADVDALVLRALERNPARRYLTLRQFLDDVERVAQGPEGGAGSTAPFGRAGKPRELKQTLAGFGFGGGQRVVDALAGQKTRQMDVQVPPEALRDGVGPQPAPAAAVAAGELASAPVLAEAAPAIGAAASGSPWGRPPGGAADPVAPAAALEHAPPAIGAPGVRAADVPLPPSLPVTGAAGLGGASGPGGPGGKQRADDDDARGDKAKFRETMWFKKGVLDAQAAEQAAVANDPAAAGKADLLPIEERYADDGTITRSDAEQFSLKTGHTSHLKAVRGGDTGQGAAVSERELVGEMKAGRTVVIVVVVVALAALAAIVAAFAM